MVSPTPCIATCICAVVETWSAVTICVLFLSFSVSVSPSTLDKPECRSAMPAGSSTVWSMASSRTDRCHPIKPSVEETTPLIPSSVRRALESTSPELCLSTWNLPLLVSAPRRAFVCKMLLLSNFTQRRSHKAAVCSVGVNVRT